MGRHSEKRATHKLFVDVKISPDQSVSKVLCETYLPDRFSDPVDLVFYPNKEQAAHLTRCFECSISGEVNDPGGSPQVRVNGGKVYIEEYKTTHWSPDISQTTISASPADLTVDSLLKLRGSQTKGVPAKGCFWVTPCAMLAPAKFVTDSYTGETSVDTVRKFEFTLTSGLHLAFDKHFVHVEKASGETLRFSELVAEFESDSPAFDPDMSVSDLDDFLAIVSFLSRQRSTCVGWELERKDKSEDTLCFRKHFRRSITIPKKVSEGDSDAALCAMRDFPDFVAQLYRSFIAIRDRDLLRQVLHRAIPREDQTLESSYMTMSSAIETVLLFFRRNCNLEQILSDEPWRSLASSVKKFIKQQPEVAEEKTKKEFMYEKIAELNRISFAASVRLVCQESNLDFNDLWPLTGSPKPTLSEIRNKLVHGDTFTPPQERALWTAINHLQWTLERLIMAILGGDIARSNVCGNRLRHWKPYQEWTEDIRLFVLS